MLISRFGQLRNLVNNSIFSFALTKEAIPRRFLNRQKKRPELLNEEDKAILYNPVQAIHLMRLHTFTSFPEAVEVCIRLNVNPKNGEQIVRGTANMPSGLGKQIKTAVLCTEDEWQELQKSGAKVDYRLKEADIKDLESGPIPFEKLFTTPEHLPKLKPYGKQLGPKGLMPNAKLGTLVPFNNLIEAFELAKAGQVSFRVDMGRNIHAQIGLMRFTDEQLLINWMALMKSLVQKRPPTLKGKYFTQAYLKSTMGPRWKINLVDIDPRTQKSMWYALEADLASEAKTA